MEEVAQMLGVKMGERFNIKYDDGTFSSVPLHLDVDGLKSICDLCDNSLARLLAGKYTIEKLPWKPKIDDTYWYVDINGHINGGSWDGCVVDYAYYYVGNCFETEEEAEAHKQEILDKLRKKYEGDGK
jgi:hypothetical protein